MDARPTSPVRLSEARLETLAATLHAGTSTEPHSDAGPLPVETQRVREGSFAAEAEHTASLLLAFSASTDGDKARKMRSATLAAPRTRAVPAHAVVPHVAVPEELAELQQRGEVRCARLGGGAAASREAATRRTCIAR